ncbi:hypothetical protein GCM10007385_35120 [Tateyamaria omphalii]|uniref:hypothetical protein n=1 Tax=Tateyamaria omphalii TaxID=299262 RepID=UPI001677770D|nr:hypothetical protein [Tateyamaria omphalii]GGX62969.1 hypothetical protein GCM10007385_35120 [Tateyamaria omphalii]
MNTTHEQAGAAQTATSDGGVTPPNPSSGDKPMYYAETRNTYGQWVPCRLASIPVVKKGRIERPNGTGPRIRPMGDGPDGKPSYVKEIPRNYAHLTLDQLFHVLSPDGKFTVGQQSWVAA